VRGAPRADNVLPRLSGSAKREDRSSAVEHGGRLAQQRGVLGRVGHEKLTCKPAWLAGNYPYRLLHGAGRKRCPVVIATTNS
jgi:hypothetical protein